MRLLVISNHVALPGNPESDSFIRERVGGLRANGADVHVMPIRAITVAHHMRSLTRSHRPERVGWRPAGNHGDSAEMAAPLTMWPYVQAQRGLPRRAAQNLALCIARAVNLDSYDAFIGHGAYAIPAAGIAERLSALTGRPFFAVAHGSDINFARPSALPYLRSVFSSAAGAFFVSDALRAKAVDLGFRRDNMYVTPNGVDCSRFPPRVESRGRLKQVLYVGNLLAVKGADRLPGVLRALKALSGNGLEMVIVGDGPLRGRLEKELRGQQVTFMGHLGRNDVARQMRSADVLLLPSRSEGWPCVVLEAQSSGTPVVATAVGGSAEAVREGGLLCSSSPFEADRMADLAVRAAKLDRATISHHARAFDWSVLGATEVALIAELSGG